jgi:hypothetical protein
VLGLILEKPYVVILQVNFRIKSMSSNTRVWRLLAPFVLMLVLFGSAFALTVQYSSESPKAEPDVYVGVAFAGNTTQEAKVLIDRVKDYTNLFVLAVGRNPISADPVKLEEICDYAVAKDLSIIVNVGVAQANNSAEWFWNQPTLDNIKTEWTQRWGSKFLGMYYNDEPGGIQLDGSWRTFFEFAGERLSLINSTAIQDLDKIQQKMYAYLETGTQPVDYQMERDFFVNDIISGDEGWQNLTKAGFSTFTSDYGLFWWDYEGGYDTLFAELGWNCSVPEQIDLVKGAAYMQNKTWGTMITWRYNQRPYLDTPDNIYSQMMTSYKAGAKYIAIFNYPYYGSNPYGVLTEGHFVAMQRFWTDIATGHIQQSNSHRAALILPENFGWGLRNPTDTIWGFWVSDNRTTQVALSTYAMLERYGTRLDIVFEDPAYPVDGMGYSEVYFWNQTVF